MDRKCQEAFFEWKKKRCREGYKSAIGLVSVAALIIVLAASMETLELEQYVFLVVMIGIVAVLFVNRLKYAYECNHVQYECVACGIVVQKERFKNNDSIRRYRYRSYWLTIETEAGMVEAHCDMDTYRTIELNQIVLVWTFKTGEMHAAIFQ